LQPGKGSDTNDNSQSGDTVHGNQSQGDGHNNGPQADPSGTLGFQSQMTSQMP
jgi:hypothetical protein